jgi:hypothetical protein
MYTVLLSEPMGMVINPNGQVAKVTPGGQAERLGVAVGSTLAAVGADPAATLADLKAAVAASKVAGETSLEVTLRAPVRPQAAAAFGQAAAAARHLSMLRGNKQELGLGAAAATTTVVFSSPAGEASSEAASGATRAARANNI